MKEDREAEDWCFICKDGGDLILCEDSNCSKVYHLECLPYQDLDQTTTSELHHNWTCDCHSCASCQGASEVHCFCCPTSFCNNCVKSVKFLPLRPNNRNGLCSDCWTLVRLAEKLSFSKKYVDFDDRDTHECLFKEYWEIVKEEQGLSIDDLVAVEEAYNSSKPKRKLMKGSPSKSTHNDNTHLPLTSKPLIEFLTSIGVDTTNQHLSQSDVTSIIFKYVQDKDLIHSIKKNKVICDRNLHLIFKKNTLPLKHIDLLLRPHFPRNANANTYTTPSPCLEPDQDNEETFVPNKQQKTLSPPCCSEEIKSPKDQKKATHFASLIAHNIKLVYLRRSLVEDLLKQPESFEDKLVGSFVKVVIKSDSSQELHSSKGKISRPLLQVTAVKKMSSRDGRDNIVLHVWTLPDIIQIGMLSDSDLTEEDCQDLREKMAKGLLQRPTVEEIEKKARILHQDIRKNWMERELVNLQNLIDRANEKGRRSELYQLIEQRQALKKEAEQQQQPLLLKQQLPTVIADSAEAKAEVDVDVDADADARKNWIESELVNLQNLIDRANEKGRRNELYQLIEQRQKLKKEAEEQQQTLVLKEQFPTVIANSAETEADAPSLKFTLVRSKPH